MVRRPKYAKPDTGQDETIQELRDLGFDVDVMPLPNQYDYVVSGEKLLPRGGTVCSVRVEHKPPGEKLRENQKLYHMNQNHRESLITIECTEDVLRWFGR